MTREALSNLIVRRIAESAELKRSLLCDEAFVQVVASAGESISAALRCGRKVLFFGNGGSAADAQHLAAELTGRYLKERDSLAGMALTTNSSSLTAIGNDYSFEMTFARQLQGLGSRGDIAFGITTTGNSANVLAAMRVATEKGLETIGLTGGGGGKLREMVNHCICIPSAQTPRIQECHIMTGHILCEIVENALSDEGNLP